MTAEQLAEIKRRCEAATPGPWSVWNTMQLFAHKDDAIAAERIGPRYYTSIVGVYGEDGRDIHGFAPDMVLMAHARDDIPALVNEVERLRAALVAVEWTSWPDEWTDPRNEFCPWCKNYNANGHRPDCQRQLALGMQP